MLTDAVAPYDVNFLAVCGEVVLQPAGRDVEVDHVVVCKQLILESQALSLVVGQLHGDGGIADVCWREDVIVRIDVLLFQREVECHVCVGLREEADRLFLLVKIVFEHHFRNAASTCAERHFHFAVFQYDLLRRAAFGCVEKRCCIGRCGRRLFHSEGINRLVSSRDGLSHFLHGLLALTAVEEREADQHGGNKDDACDGILIHAVRFLGSVASG